MKAKLRKLMSVLVVLAVSNVAAGEILLTGVIDGDPAFAECNGGITPGGTFLLPAFIVEPGNPDTMYALYEDFPDWTFDWALEPLDGTLWVDEYYAFDSLACVHGAHISVAYDKGPGDPEYMDWIQIFESSLPWADRPAGIPMVDPYPNDPADDGPFYFSIEDDPWKYYKGPGGDIVFGDTPQYPFDEATEHHIRDEFVLYLVSINPLDPTYVTLHEGLFWGYDGACVPEPASLSLLLVGALALLRRRAA